MFGRNGEPDRRTDNSVEQSIGGEGLENLSLLPHKDGRAYLSVKSDIFSLGNFHEGKDADDQDHAHSFRGEDKESDRGYETEPAPMIEMFAGVPWGT